MNIIIPPKVVVLLRYVLALAIGVPIVLEVGGYQSSSWDGMYLPILQFFYLPWLVMIAPKREILFGFLLATLTWVHFAVFECLDDKQNRPDALWQNLAGNVAGWFFTCLLSLIITVPIYQWRKWRRTGRINSTPQQASFNVEQDSNVWPPAPKP